MVFWGGIFSYLTSSLVTYIFSWKNWIRYPLTVHILVWCWWSERGTLLRNITFANVVIFVIFFSSFISSLFVLCLSLLIYCNNQKSACLLGASISKRRGRNLPRSCSIFWELNTEGEIMWVGKILEKYSRSIWKKWF